MDTLFLKISGFVLKITFETANDDLVAEIANKRIKKSIIQFYKAFITIDYHSRPDFHLILKRLPKSPLLIRKGKTVYGAFFEEVSENKFICLNSITIFQFSIILRQVLLRLFSTHSGILIHSSSSRSDNSAYIFVGKSGAGKTTTMRMLTNKYPPLGDDSSIIKKEGGNYYFYQTPFFEGLWPIKRNGRRYSLNKVLFLVKSNKFKLKKIIDKNEVFAKLSEQIVAEDKHLHHYFPFLKEFVENFNEFYYLYFAKNSTELIKLLKG
jgi:hypothetical protein